jgi:hypothetical protein
MYILILHLIFPALGADEKAILSFLSSFSGQVLSSSCACPLPLHQHFIIRREAEVVAPRRFKNLAGRGHAEFSSARQQDAAEYFQHLLEVRNFAGVFFPCTSVLSAKLTRYRIQP